MVSIYLIIGAFAGIMSGLFGIGGGIIVIPALSAIFLHESIFAPAYVMQMAVGTSLAIMIVTSLSALYIHHKHSVVRWPIFNKMLPGLMIGALAGVVIAQFLPSSILQIAFGLFLLVQGIRLVLNRPSKESNRIISTRTIKILSVFMGCLSSILGMGGGTVIVPFLLRCSLDMREAMGTSVACSLSIALAATLGFMVMGLMSKVHTLDSTGYVYWPAFLGIAVASVLFAPVGAMLSHKLPRDFLKRIFGILLLLMACDMLF